VGLERTKVANRINEIVVATTCSDKDDVIVREVGKIKNDGVFRGSEKGVLGQYYKAAQKFEAVMIVRITSDCPLIDPVIVDTMIEIFLERSAENTPVNYVSKNLIKTFPRCLDAEVFSFEVLEMAFNEAAEFGAY